MSSAAALISARVVTGLADEKLHELAPRVSKSNAHHIVVLHESNKKFMGVIRLAEVVAAIEPGKRILADLLPSPSPLSVKLSETADNIAELFEKHQLGEVAVFTEDNRYVGLITAESVLKWSYERWQSVKPRIQTGPVIADQSPRNPREAIPDRSSVGRPVTILLVEDHEASRSVLKTILVRRHFLVTEARSLQEAWSLVKSGDFDLMISDIGLPDGTGYELMHSVKERGIVGISMTAASEPTEILMSAAAGFSYHFTKPLEMSALLDAIHKIVDARSGKDLV